MLNTIKFILRHPIGARTPSASILAWAKWQIGSRLVPGPVEVPFIGPTRLVVSPGMTGATGNIYCGLHEFEDMSFTIHLLRAGDLFADVGANVGSYTVLAAGVVGARAHAFEPVPVTYRALLRNVRANALDDLVRLSRVCIGASAGEVDMIADQDTTNRVVRDDEGAGSSIRVPMMPLDDLLAEEAPTLIKIDVEGYEEEVLAGAGKTLGSDGLLALVVEVTGEIERRERVLRAIRAHGLEPVDYDPFARKLTTLPGLHPRRGNTIFVKDLVRADQRVRSALPIRIRGVNI